MLIGLTGLHGAGKSFISNMITTEFNFKYVNKKDLLKQYYKNQTGRNDNQWVAWSRIQYQINGGESFMENIVPLLPKDDNIILDSVHNPDEWKTIKKHRPESILAAVITPEIIRITRAKPKDDEKNIKRINYWHDGHKGNKCLLSEAEWSFNGAISYDLQRKNFEALIEFIARHKLLRIHQSKQYIINQNSI